MNTEQLIDLILDSIAKVVDRRLASNDEAAEVALHKLQLRWNEERPLEAGGAHKSDESSGGS